MTKNDKPTHATHDSAGNKFGKLISYATEEQMAAADKAMLEHLAPFFDTINARRAKTKDTRLLGDLRLLQALINELTERGILTHDVTQGAYFYTIDPFFLEDTQIPDTVSMIKHALGGTQ